MSRPLGGSTRPTWFPEVPMSRFILPPLSLLLFLTLNAAPSRAQSVVFLGHTFDPVGTTTVGPASGTPPTLPVTLPATGDGLDIGLGGSGGGVTWDPWGDPTTFADGGLLRIDAIGDVNGLLDQAIASLEVGVTGGVGEIVASFPGLGTPTFRAELYSGGQLVSVLNSPSSIQVDAFPVGVDAKLTWVPADLTSSTAPGTPAGLWPGISLQFPAGTGATAFFGKTAKGGEEFIDAIIFLAEFRLGDPQIAQRLHQVYLEKLSDGLQVTVAVRQVYGYSGDIKLNAKDVRALAAAQFIQFGDFGLCGENEIRVNVEEDETKNMSDIEEVVLKRNDVECAQIRIYGSYQGGATESLALVEVIDTGTQLDFLPDYSRLGVSDRAFYLNDGQIVAVPPPGTPIEVLQRAFPTGYGGFFFDSFNFGHRFTWENDVVALAPFGGTVMVDEIQVVVDAPIANFTVTSLGISFGNASGTSNDFLVKRAGAKGRRGPSGASYSHLQAKGRTHVRRGGGSLRVLEGSGSSGQDGAFLDLNDTSPRQQLLWVDFIDTTDTTRSVSLTALGEPIGLPPRPLGDLDLAINAAAADIAADFSSVNSSSAAVVVYNGGTPVDVTLGVPFGQVATVTGARPRGIVKEESFLTQAPDGYTVLLDNVGTIALIGSKRAVQGDAVQVLAENPIAPTLSVLQWEIGLVNVPLFFLTDVSSGTSVTPAPPRPVPTQLKVAPNPFNPRTSISFELAQPGPVAVRVYGLNGRHVSTLHNGWLGVGPRTLAWDGRDHAGRSVASGVYLLRMESRQGVATARAVLLK